MGFEYTNRKADLTRDTWRAGMPWDLRYTETAGYEDRDQEIEAYLATLDRRGSGAPLGTGTSGDQYWDITNKRLYLSDGTGWIIMYEPIQVSVMSFNAGVTVGNGAAGGYYVRQAGFCYIQQEFVFGTTSAVTASVIINLPIATAGVDSGQLQTAFFDSSAGNLSVGCVLAATTSPITVFANNAAGTYLSINVLAAAVPFVWATSDIISLSGLYRMNTPYL